METPTGSGEITISGLTRQNARWRMFSRLNPDHKQLQFIAKLERYHSQSREIQLLITRSTPSARDS